MPIPELDLGYLKGINPLVAERLRVAMAAIDEALDALEAADLVALEAAVDDLETRVTALEGASAKWG